MSFVKRDNISVFEVVAVCRDGFKSEMQKAYKNRNEAIARAKKYSNEAGLKLATREADSEYEKAVDRAKFRASELYDTLKEAERVEVQRVQTIDTNKLSKIKMLADRVMTAEELGAIARIDGFTLDYWTASVLRDIAEQSELCLEDLPGVHVGASLSTKLGVLDEIKNECEEMLSKYDPSESSVADAAFLADSHIEQWMNKYTNGLRSAGELSDSAIVRRAYGKITSAWNEAERGKALKEQLDSVPERCKIALINRVAESRIIGDVALRVSGYEDTIREFRDNGGTEQYKNAIDSVRKISDATTDREAIEEAGRMAKEPYFMMELRKAGETSERAKHAYEVTEQSLKGE